MSLVHRVTKNGSFRYHGVTGTEMPSRAPDSLVKYADLPDHRLTLVVRNKMFTHQLDTIKSSVPSGTVTEVYIYIEDMYYFQDTEEEPADYSMWYIKDIMEYYKLRPRVFYCAYKSHEAQIQSPVELEYYFWYLLDLAERAPERLTELPIVTEDPEYKLSCFNLTCTDPRQHKLVVASYLDPSASYITHHHYDEHDVDIARNRIEMISKHTDKLHAGLTRLLNVKSPGNMDRFNVNTNLDVSQGDFMLAELSNSVVNIVTETLYFKPYACITEKSIKPAIVRRPFVIVSSPGSLQLMKELGFKTFDRWWDESYDEEPDPYKRMHKIFDIIDQLESMSLGELCDMLDDMKDVLDHNSKNIANLKKAMDDFVERERNKN